MCPKRPSADLFKGLTEGDLPRLASVESWTEGVWFDLISRNIMTPARFPAAGKSPACLQAVPAIAAPAPGRRRRSEEHTSELQSLLRISYAVFCSKKKKQHHRPYYQYKY